MNYRIIKYRIFITLVAAILVSMYSVAQYGPCDPIVPEYVLDLTGNPDSSWVQANIIRDGSCCGYADPPNSCVKFIITLDPEADGIMFNVVDGALPNNLEWQLMNDAQDECNPEIYPAGVPVCLDSPGPHYIIFCKPGGNDNTYIITSVSSQSFSPDVVVNEGCTDTISALGFDEATVTWTSVYPGVPGEYNGSLDCEVGCDTVLVTGQPDFPDYVDYQVCGSPFGYGECSEDTICDTIRVYFNSTLGADIQPNDPVICTGGESIELTGNGSGGSPPYTYLWNTGETTQNITVSGGGVYTLEVSDTSGCPSAFDTIEVVENESAIEAEAGPHQVICFAIPEVTLSGSVITATGGTWWGGNGTFDPSADSLNTTYYPTAQEIAAGGMWLYLTTTGNGPCPSATDSVYITFDEFNASLLLNTSDVTCNGFNDGNADISAIGGYPPYSYSWSFDPVETGTNVTDLIPGTYTIIITDSLGCDSVMSFTITEPEELALSITGSDISCYGGSDGSVDLTVTGGTEPYNCTWSEGSVTTHVSDLPAGEYNVTVIDNNGCISTSSIILIQPDLLELTYSSNDITCYGYSDGSIVSGASGGTPPLVYNIGAGTQSSGVFNNLDPGNYQVTVTDANGCTVESPVMTITEPDLLQGSLSGINVSCNDGSDGSVDLSVNGGTPLYSFNWSNGSVTEDIGNLQAGSYTVTVTDNNGCTVTNSLMITEPNPLVLNFSYTDVVCYGASDGTVTVNVTGGTPPVNYNLGTGTQGSGYFSGLPPGNYQVTVTDANGCSVLSDNFTIDEPSDIVIDAEQHTNITCNGNDDGTIDISASGGTNPLYYNLGFGIQGSGNFTGLPPGTYTVTVTDANGCTETGSIITITEPNLLQISLSGSNVNCYGGSEGAIDMSVTGGTPLYSYLWSDLSITEDISDLTAGTYSVTVTDNNGCIVTGSYIITEPDSLHLNTSAGDVTCYGYSDGYTNVSVSGGVYPYSYLWGPNTGYQNTSTAIDLDADIYQVTITDANGCTKTAFTEVYEPDAMILAVSPEDVTCYEGNDGSATVVATGGTTPYFYSWDPNTGYQNTSTAEGLSPGSYSVTVTDANACTNTISVSVDQPSPVIVQASADVIICVGENTAISASASGGNGTFSYFWYDGVGYGQSHNVSPESTTIYTVQAYDYLGCVSEPDMVTVTVRNLFLDNIDVITEGTICKGDTTTVTGIHDGDIPPYFYSWNHNFGSGLGPFSVSPQTTTTYILSVSDICGNSISDSVIVNVYPYPVINIPENIAEGCQPLTVNFTDTINPETCEFLWDFGDGSVSHLQNPEHVYYDSGIHNVTLTVTSAEGCVAGNDGLSYVNVFPNRTPVINASPPVASINDPTVYFSLDIYDYEYYTWEFGDGDTSYLPNPSHTYQDTGYYFVYLTVINEYECVNNDSVLVIIEPDYDFLIPNAFTPDPSGPSGGEYDINAPNNDVFFPITDYVEDFHMMIFNRWGELIFETFDINIGWDGYYHEKLCKQDVYVWKVEVNYVDGYELVRAGTVTLVR